MSETETHVRAIALRRLSAGELAGDEAAGVEAHAASCAACRARLKEIGDEQRRFEQEISFDRFAAGVERAARAPRADVHARAPARRWLYPTLAMAAAVALTLTFVPRARDRGDGDGGGGGLNHLKGGAGITVQIAAASNGAQRTASSDSPDALAPGDRLRIGYQAGPHRFLTSVSIDDQGQVTPLYPESGPSLPVGAARGSASATSSSATRYLPDSLELTGKGTERVIVILGDQPIDVGAVKQAAARAFQRARGDVAHLPPLDVPGEQFQRTFRKP